MGVAEVGVARFVLLKFVFGTWFLVICVFPNSSHCRHHK